MGIKTTERSQVARLDIDMVETQSWAHREFPIHGIGSRNVVQVVVRRSTLEAIRAHGLSRTDVEVCGVLVGGYYKDERGPYLYVEHMIKGEHAENQVAQVTFTAETWSHIQSQMDSRFAEKRILGWYHTHPGFGIFLSPMDMFIHENFFNSSEQLALVYDPLSGDDGLFVWHQGAAVAIAYLVQEDSPAALVCSDQSSSQPRSMTAAGSADTDLKWRIDRVERRLRWLTFLVVAAVVTATAVPLAQLTRQNWLPGKNQSVPWPIAPHTPDSPADKKSTRPRQPETHSPAAPPSFPPRSPHTDNDSDKHKNSPPASSQPPRAQGPIVQPHNTQPHNTQPFNGQSLGGPPHPSSIPNPQPQTVLPPDSGLPSALPTTNPATLGQPNTEVNQPEGPVLKAPAQATQPVPSATDPAPVVTPKS